MAGDFKHTDLTEKIIEVFYKVYSALGYGFLEKVYENSMAIEFRKSGIRYQQQAPITVHYDDEVVGVHNADLLVEDSVIVELKSTKQLVEEHEAQLLNYLKATTFEVGLLLNFGPKPEIKRKAFDNERKGNLSWVKSQQDADSRI